MFLGVGSIYYVYIVYYVYIIYYEYILYIIYIMYIMNIIMNIIINPYPLRVYALIIFLGDLSSDNSTIL